MVVLQSPLGCPRPAGSMCAVPLCVVALLWPPWQPSMHIPACSQLWGVLALPEHAPHIVLLPLLASDTPKHVQLPPTAASCTRAWLSCSKTWWWVLHACAVCQVLLPSHLVPSATVPTVMGRHLIPVLVPVPLWWKGLSIDLWAVLWVITYLLAKCTLLAFQW